MAVLKTTLLPVEQGSPFSVVVDGFPWSHIDDLPSEVVAHLAEFGMSHSCYFL